jgi:hypothetical protein
MSEATTREPRPLFRGPLLVRIFVIYLVIAVLLAVVGPLFMHPPGDDSIGGGGAAYSSSMAVSALSRPMSWAN